MTDTKVRAAASYTLLFLLTCIGILSSPYAPDNDLYLHLKRGEWMVKTLSLLKTDIFTYTQAQTPDEAIHSWLPQLLFFKIHQWTGEFGLRCLNVACVYSSLLFLFFWLKNRTRSETLALVGSALGLALHQRFQLLRPFLIAELFFSLFVFALLNDRLLKQRFHLILALLLTVLWANSHASVVILPFLFLSWGLGYSLQKRKTKAVLLNFILLFLGTLLNPQGIGIYRYAIELSYLGKQLGGSEWQVHWPIEILGSLLSPLGLKFHYDINQIILCLSILALVLILYKRQNKYYPECFLALTCCSLALLSNRHLTYLLFPLALSIQFLFEKYRESLNRLFVPSLVITPMLLFFIGFQESFHVESGISQATKFLKSNSFHGNIFNFHTWGSSLIYDLYPNAKVASDARSLVHREFFLKLNHLNSLSLEERRKRILELLPPNTDLLFLSTSEQSWQPLLHNAGYIQIYENNVVTLALKRHSSHSLFLKQITSLYRSLQIPFDPEKGCSMEQAYLYNPVWAEQNTETVPWGAWPVPLVRSRWAISQSRLYAARKIPIPDSITQLLNTNPHSNYGGLRSFTLNFQNSNRKLYSAVH